MAHIQQGTKQYKLASFALFAAGFVTYANLYLTQPLMPQLAKQFDITPAVASLSLSVTTVVLAFSMILFGSLSEAWGRKKLMCISIFAASILTVFVSFSSSYEMLLLLRILQGFVFAGVPAIAMAYLGEEMEPKSLGVAMGLYISGNSIGGLAGRIIIGSFTDLVGWHIAVLILGLVSIIVSFYFIWALPSSRNFKARPLQLKQLATSLVAHLKDQTLLYLFGIGFMLMGSFVTLYNYIGFKLTGAPYNLSTALVGWIFIVYLVGTFSSTWFGSLSMKHGRQKVMYAGIYIMITGAVLTLPNILAVKILGIVIFTFGFFGAHSIASGWVTFQAKKDRAQASSLYLFSYYVGSSIGGTVGGFFWMHFGWHGVIEFILCILLACTLFAYGIQCQSTKSLVPHEAK